MAAIQKGDFIEIDYTGYTNRKEVFDTTSKEVAEKHDLDTSSKAFKPMTVCVGERFLIGGLDTQLVGKEVGQMHSIELSSEEAFGKKNPKLIQMVPARKFKEYNIMPFPGLQVNIDGMLGTVRTVSSGRILVDFNHILAGKDVKYEITVHKVVEDDESKVNAYLGHLGLNERETTFSEGVLTIKLQHEIDDAIRKSFDENIKRVIPAIKEIKFEVAASTEKKAGNAPAGEN